MEHTSNTTVDVAAAASKKPQRKLRSACDSCHQTKVKCSRGKPCQTCQTLELECVYSVSNRIGRPRGTKNKRTIERLNREKALADANRLEAERGRVYQDFAAHMLHTSSPTRYSPISSDLHGLQPQHQQQNHQQHQQDPRQCLTGTDGVLLSDVMGSLPPGFGQYTTPLSAPPPAPGMVEPQAHQWSHLSNEQMANWLHEQIPKPQNHVEPLSATSPCDMPYAATLETLQQPYWMGAASVAPQGYYLTPTPSIQGTETRTSPDFHHAVVGGNIQQQRQISPSDSSIDGGSVSRRSSVVTRPGRSRRTMTESSLMSFSPCNCLQTQTEMLFRSKGLSIESSMGINGTLEFAKQAISAWRSILQCDICRQGSGECETWTLCVMSIRNFIRSLQCLHANVGYSEFGEATILDYMSPAGRSQGGGGGSLEGSPSGEIAMSRVASSQSHGANIDVDSWASQAIISKVLLCRVLAQIKEILAALRHLLEAWRNPSENENDANEQRHAWRRQQQNYYQQLAGHISPGMAGSVWALGCGSEGRAWTDDSRAEEGDDAVHLLTQVKCLEMAVYSLTQRLKDWALA